MKPSAENHVDRVLMPRREFSPFAQILRRVGLASSLVVFVALVVRLGRDGYVDITDSPISFLDAVYYASVTVTTTGYGDISAVSDSARLAAIVLITPARILFLILVVSTTVEVLTDQSRQLLLTRRWRQNVNDHYIICGFGATGQSVAQDLFSREVPPTSIVVVDIDEEAVALGARLGMVGVVGDASQQAVLRQAGIEKAQAVVVVPNRDDTAVLVTLTARELNSDVHIVAGGRERENLHFLRQGGADEVIDAAANLGRILGLGTYAPSAARVLDDILDAGTGLELAEVSPEPATNAVPAGVTLVSIVRGGQRMRPDQVDLDSLDATDRLVVLRQTLA